MRTASAKIESIICPTDLSPRSQLAVGLAANLASRLSARLTAVHCRPGTWFGGETHLSETEIDEINQKVEDGARCGMPYFPDDLDLETVVFEGGADAATDIVRLARETSADLLVMKARRGVFSALHFGSIVERVTRTAPCPVLLLPNRFLDIWDGEVCSFKFREILFDYEFSETTNRLLPVAMALSEGLSANLHLLSVLEPPPAPVAAEMTQAGLSRSILHAATNEKLNRVISTSAISNVHLPATVEWGKHAQTVLRYAAKHEIDLICTTLMAPQVYFDRLYCIYLGQLLQRARCPILVMRAV